MRRLNPSSYTSRNFAACLNMVLQWLQDIISIQFITDSTNSYQNA